MKEDPEGSQGCHLRSRQHYGQWVWEKQHPGEEGREYTPCYRDARERWAAFWEWFTEHWLHWICAFGHRKTPMKLPE